MLSVIMFSRAKKETVIVRSKEHQDTTQDISREGHQVLNLLQKYGMILFYDEAIGIMITIAVFFGHNFKRSGYV